MAERALELLALPNDQPALLLDIGCGSGLSGDVLSDAGHEWIGIDVSNAMLKVAQDDREVTGDLLLGNMGHGLSFRAGAFDGAISISAIQWLCHANSRDENPHKRLLRFFQSLYACLGRGARAVFQFYPENDGQSNLISDQAAKAAFFECLKDVSTLIFFRIYLVLMTGGVRQLPRALTGAEEDGKCISNVGRRNFNILRRAKEKPRKGSKAWIEMKKERARKKGKDVRETSKYSGRKRRRLF
ncbi:unnamed protein product [Enterobius vermicularis]|uniref:18S rRNA (Guanine-N(7))-methyltransferase n=1 Tax=Enterobius vermicularis TaxID=51028 RepID=A0A0N4VQ57_ENTVE|nr:unnamed protein product [Enterobius vermicularis]